VTLLNLAGISFQIVGLVVTAYGLAKTWRNYKPEGVGFLDPPVRWRRDTFRRIASLVSRFSWRGRRRSVTFEGHAGAVSSTSASLGRGRVGFPPLPRSAKAAIAELDERTRKLMDLVSDTLQRCDEESDRARLEIVALGTRLEQDIARLEQHGIGVAIGGIRTAATGLCFVALGVVFQGLAELLG
jgi:hypothetical protein